MTSYYDFLLCIKTPNFHFDILHFFVLCFLKIMITIFGSLIYLSYITYIKQKTYSVGYYIKDNGRNSKTHP